MDKVERIKTMYQSADLHPELEPYYSVQNGIPMIKHPLVFSIFHTDFQNYIINKHYEWKKTKVAEALKNEEWGSYVFLHERPYRLEAFLEVMGLIKDPDTYWELLGNVWVDSENIWQNKEVWRELIEYGPEKGRESFMSEDERKVFEGLPDRIKVYRGYMPGRNKSGFSYTLSPKKAKWFANRFGEGKVTERMVDKSDIFAYKGGRNEQEVIVLN